MSDATQNDLTSSQEDYLEAILYLVRKSRVARVRDIAGRLDVGMSSVTAALKSLAAKDLVNYDPYQFITLTDRGREVAERITARHELIRRFLTDVLGLDRDVAEANACRMEHAVDQVVLDRLRDLAQFVRQSAGSSGDGARAFPDYCATGSDGARGGRQPADGTPEEARCDSEDAP
jgi:DtxR family Mn-dependent transcriptional regulator